MSNGVGTTMPVYAGGRSAASSRTSTATGSSTWARASQSPRSATHHPGGRRGAEQVADFTHTCFMITPYEGYVAVAEALNRLTPGTDEKRSALFNSGSEAVENAIKIARAYTRKQAVVAFDHAYHGRTNLTMALTAKSMPYKRGFGPFAPEVYRRHCPIRSATDSRQGVGQRRRIGRQARHRVIDKQVGADNLAAVIIEPIQGEGGFIVPRRRLPGGAARLVSREQRGVHRRRGADRVRPHRRDVRVRTRRDRARSDRHSQGHRRRAALVGGDRPRRDHGRPAR